MIVRQDMLIKIEQSENDCTQKMTHQKKEMLFNISGVIH